MTLTLLRRGRDWTLLGLPWALVFVTHLFYGAFLPVPALSLVASGSALTLLALLNRERADDLAGVRGLKLIAAVFVAVMAVGFWSLTDAMPSGVHPLWIWAGREEGAATIDRSATVIELLKLMGLACFFVLGCLLGARSERARKTLTALLAIGAVWALWAFVTFLGSGQRLSATRLDGGFYTSNSAGTVLGMLMVVAVGWTLSQWRQTKGLARLDQLSRAIPGLACVLLFAACLLLTSSRAAIGATLLAVMLVMVCDGVAGGSRRFVRIWVVACAAAIGLAVYAATRTSSLQRFDTVGIDAELRRTLLDVHWQAFLASPLTGHGLGTYTWINNQQTTAETYPILSATVVLHNAPIQWLEEAGLLGALPMFGLVVSIIGFTVCHALHRRSDRSLLFSLVAASLLIVLHSLADVSLQTPSITAFWALILGVGYAASQASMRR